MADTWDSLMTFTGLDDLGLGGHDPKDLYGTKPIIPEAPTTLGVAKEALAANRAVLPDAKALASDLNLFNQTELDKLIERAVPGGPAQIKKNIAAQMRGELPPDVLANMHRVLASQAIAGGFSGSGYDYANKALHIGETSLQQMLRGQDSYTRWIAASIVPLSDVSKSFISPSMQWEANNMKFQRDLMAAKVAAAPDPVKRGEFDTFMGTMGMILGAYSGGGYGQTYRPDYGGSGGGPWSSGTGGWGGSGYVPKYNSPSTGGWPDQEPDTQYAMGGGGGASTLGFLFG